MRFSTRLMGRTFPVLTILAALATSLTLGATAARADQKVNRSPQRHAELLAELDRVTAAAQAGTSSESALLAAREAVDTEAAQRFGWASRLFWHTDLDQALAAARRDGKPVLSLRMLGRLTDEFSCANSRFFRTALYPNQSVSKLLSERFVLHWSTERPVPVLTVDFGDGRVMKRTVTGNSIHYVLNPDGSVFDAMPGMVAPQVFSKWLEQAVAFHRSPSRDRVSTVDRLDSLLTVSKLQWATDLTRLSEPNRAIPKQLAPAKIDASKSAKASKASKASKGAQPVKIERAERAVVLAAPKRVAEVRLIPNLTMANCPVPDVKDAEFWRRLARVRVDQSRLDKSSIDLIRALQPASLDAGDEAFAEMILQFEFNIALDTVRNQYVFQRTIRGWLKDASEKGSDLHLQRLNRRVYDELFLTPRQDPFVGLFRSSDYSGLVRSGIQPVRTSLDPSTLTARSAGVEQVTLND